MWLIMLKFIVTSVALTGAVKEYISSRPLFHVVLISELGRSCFVLNPVLTHLFLICLNFQNTFHTRNNQHTEMCLISIWAISNHLFLQSSVGIVTCYGLDGLGIKSRWRAKFSTPIQTSPGARPASYTMGTRSFPGIKRPGCGVDHPSCSSAKIIERVELYFYSPSGPSWPVLGQILSLAHWVIKYSVPSLP